MNCKDLYQVNKIINDHNLFLKKVNDYLEKLTYYNKKIMLIEIRKIYDDGDYNFQYHLYLYYLILL